MSGLNDSEAVASAVQLDVPTLKKKKEKDTPLTPKTGFGPARPLKRLPGAEGGSQHY